MRSKKKVICIIPARIGSKRILKKNIKIFHNRPLIYYAIKKALRSNLFDRVIVSTDSNKIAKISKKFGAEVPFIRPKNISSSKSSTLDVLRHSIKKLNLNSKDELFCLYPTTPLLELKYIRQVKKILLSYPNNLCFTVMEADERYQRGFFLEKNKIINFFNRKNLNKISQDLSKIYIDAGQVYAAKVITINRIPNLIDKDNKFVIIDKNKVIDIDNDIDWSFAEFLFKKYRKNLIL